MCNGPKSCDFIHEPYGYATDWPAFPSIHPKRLALVIIDLKDFLTICLFIQKTENIMSFLLLLATTTPKLAIINGQCFPRGWAITQQRISIFGYNTKSCSWKVPSLCLYTNDILLTLPNQIDLQISFCILLTTGLKIVTEKSRLCNHSNIWVSY